MNLDEGGYPTEETLEEIREWPYEEADALFEAIGSIWKYPEYWQRDGRTFQVSTGGWSGHEDMIRALLENDMVWISTWQSSRRGGHYVFELPKPKEQAGG